MSFTSFRMGPGGMGPMPPRPFMGGPGMPGPTAMPPMSGPPMSAPSKPLFPSAAAVRTFLPKISNRHQDPKW